MVPLPRYQKVANKQFVVGAEYPLQIIEERNMASHNAYFAQIHSGFQNLPEEYAQEFPTETHLRRWLLIETGWCTRREFQDPLPTIEKARTVAMFCRGLDEYAKFSFQEREDGWHIIIRQARSQSLDAMGKVDFEASKKACLDKLESMIGVPHGSLKREAGRNA